MLNFLQGLLEFLMNRRVEAWIILIMVLIILFGTCYWSYR